MRAPKISRRAYLVGILVFVVLAILSATFGRSVWTSMRQSMAGKRSVEQVVQQYGAVVRPVWRERFAKLGVAYPPRSVTFIALKRERKLEVWADRDDEPVRVAEYPILAASGIAGPKLRAGDRQVPEGVYAIEGLNPNSAYHLSMKVSYPNAFDRSRAVADGRTSLGGDIFIHGKSASIGCLAMGDPAIEELFVLVDDVGHENVRVIIAPCDFRGECSEIPLSPAWLPDLYAEVRKELGRYPLSAH